MTGKRYYVYNKESGLKVGSKTFDYYDATQKANLANQRSGHYVYDSIDVDTYNRIQSLVKKKNGAFGIFGS